MTVARPTFTIDQMIGFAEALDGETPDVKMAKEYLERGDWHEVIGLDLLSHSERRREKQKQSLAKSHLELANVYVSQAANFVIDILSSK